MENNIGRQIRIHRLHCSMTQEKLAELLCVTPQAVSKWENGASYPDITLLPELSAALGIKIDEHKNLKRGLDVNDISAEDSKVKVLVIATNEELMIARDTAAIVSAM